MADPKNIHETQAMEMRAKEKIEEIQVEVAASELNTVDLDRISKEAFAWKSRAGLRVFVIILIQGISTSILKSVPFMLTR